MASCACVCVVLVCFFLLPVETAAVDSRNNVAAAADTNSDVSSSPLFMDVLMKEAKPVYSDAYLCTGYEVQEDEAYVLKFEAQAFADTVHHILIYGCEGGAASSENFWSCPPICTNGRQQIMFAWAKNAPPTELPEGVGMRIGKNTTIKVIVMQIHYAKAFTDADAPDKSGIRLHLSRHKQQYAAGVFLLMSYNFAVPPNQSKYHVDISCAFNENYTMVPFAYRTHAHALSTVISGYQHNNTGYHMIGKGNPMWPQAFYPTNTRIEVRPGDHLVARCTYNSMNMEHTVRVGSTGKDEMCNFYIMFYTNASVPDPSGQCGGVDLKDLVDNLPLDSDVTLPPQPLLEAEAHGHHHHHDHHDVMTGGSSTTQPVGSHAEGIGSHGAGSSGSTAENAEPLTGHLVYQSDWPTDDLHIGQVGGVATDSKGYVYIFHRGDRIWDQMSFDANNNFMHKDQPIQQDTVLILSPEGHLVRKFGAGQYFMPHGITVDHKGNIWLTDVALHQVFRIPAGGTMPNLMLGERFVRGSDHNHFCKPTDVAVLPSGEFFVADGYCNSRIVKFSKDGHFLKEWGQFGTEQAGPGHFYTAHSVTVAPSQQLVCVADRDNGRIQCFDFEGNFRFIIRHAAFGSALYAVEYCLRHGGLLFAVNGGESKDIQGFTFSLSNQTLLETWNMPSPQKLSSPHDVAVDGVGHAVYVGELRPPALRKFLRLTVSGSSQITTAIHATATTTTTTTTETTAATTKTTTTTSAFIATASASKVKPGSVGQIVSTVKVSTEAGVETKMTTKKEGQVTRFLPVMLVGPLVAIPLVVVMAFFIIRQFKGSGGKCIGSNGSHKGFDPLLQHHSDDSDSENEMFLQPRAQRKAPFK